MSFSSLPWPSEEASLQDTDVELALIQAVAAGLGVALLPAQAKKDPHDNVVSRDLHPRVLTESCIAWKGDNSSDALKACINLVSNREIRMRLAPQPAQASRKTSGKILQLNGIAATDEGAGSGLAIVIDCSS